MLEDNTDDSHIKSVLDLVVHWEVVMAKKENCAAPYGT